eukprot:TRINITY_DN5256_c0_g1_i1.p1 TRINITY_DN5256_c0_g1~~TRINITY_DN5256_c0_g1_i1.p1  ORF type:complete len:309 (+),score=47.55 TRINITY_DN5256_c0_g1_i1:135-1061(+)
MDLSSDHFLHNNKIANIKEHRPLITVSSADTVRTVLQLLAKNEITAAPVLDSASQDFIGFVDTLDLGMFIAGVFATNYQAHPHLYDPKELHRMFDLPVSEVINASNRDPFLPVRDQESVAFLINNFLRFGVHRVPLRDANDRIYSLVSQSDVIRFLQSKSQHIQTERHKTLEELGLNRGNVISITNEETLIKAFMHIVTHKISAVAVVDFQTGELINNLSASDLKGITEETFWRLESPIHHVLLHMGPQKLPAVTCTPNTNLGELLDKFAQYGVHRIYVVSPDHKPINVITLTDVLNVFVTPFQVVAQ